MAFDRSGINSKVFNIRSDPHLFVRVIVGIATMNDSQLGYDPTITNWPSRFRYIEIEKLDEQKSDYKKIERLCID